MVKPIKTRKVIRQLRGNGCALVRDNGRHQVWMCPCGLHRAPMPASHREITAGVVRKIERMMQCLPEGWLQ